MCDSSPPEDSSPPATSIPLPKPKTPDWFIKQRAAEREDEAVRDNHGKAVRDASGKAVTSPSVSREEHDDRVHEDDSSQVADDANLTEEEAEDEGLVRANNRPFKYKSRLLIERTNPSVSVGTKKHRTGLNIPK